MAHGKDDDDGESATRKGFFLARRSESKSRREKSPVWQVLHETSFLAQRRSVQFKSENLQFSALVMRDNGLQNRFRPKTEQMVVVRSAALFVIWMVVYP